jgi:hypothetical protein
MTGLRWALIATAVVTGAMTLAACGGGGGSKNKTPASGATQAAGQSGATSAPAKATAATGDSSSGDGGGGGSDALKAITRKFTASTFKGTYNITTTGGAADTIQNGTMLLYKDGDKRLRFELTAKQDGEDVHVVFIEKDGSQFLCFDAAGPIGALIGIEPGKGACVNSNSPDLNPASSIGSAFSDLESADLTVLEQSKRTVAGKQSECFRTKDNKTAQVETACFSSDGVLTYSKTEGDSGSEIEATEVSGSVSGSDFDPPYEVKDIPGLGGGSTP